MLDTYISYTEYEALRTRLAGRTSSPPDMLGASAAISTNLSFISCPFHTLCRLALTVCHIGLGAA